MIYTHTHTQSVSSPPPPPSSSTYLLPAQVRQNRPVLPLDAVGQLLAVAVVLATAEAGDELGQLTRVQLQGADGQRG